MTQRIAILVHGFNVDNPELTIGKLRPFLLDRGYDVVMFDYGPTNLWQVRFRNKRLAKKLASWVSAYKCGGNEVHVFSHSNGAAITRIATAKYHAEIEVTVKKISLNRLDL